MAVIAAGSRGEDTNPWQLATLVTATVLVLWVAHVYAHALSDSLVAGRRAGWVELRGLRGARLLSPRRRCARRRAGARALEVIPEQSSIRLALGIGVATLAVQGVRYARVERFGRTATVVAVTVNVALGLVIVALEVALAH